ncbi:thioesterase family protein [Stappia sp. F7233]|uniref:Thioesterase family protein n=1 Tax=Stappia albiluteola TaxID=2758565 RepID=A0A839AJK1_9HYPH|nr:thioesterase family protein [Stappia albiluteola]MBA5779144.1 thioesterase family protein [Stappia albiluteola]
MPAVETLFSFVNRWECDENEHLNVQYYFSRFEEADRQFRLLTGLSDALAGPRRCRHVRYHRELCVGHVLLMTSYAAVDGPHMLTIVHELRTDDGALAATAIDGYSAAEGTVRELRRRFKPVELAMPEYAMPRGLPAAVSAMKSTLDGLIAGGAAIVNRSTVTPRNLGPEGRADDELAIGRFTEAAPHVWNMTPMTSSWLAERDLGRVAVEMKLAWLGPLKAGDPIIVVSAPIAASRSTFAFRHHLFETRASRLAAVCETVALTMDLKTRKAVPLPDDIRKAILERTLSS